MLLRLSSISRSFGAIQALKNADFEIGESEVMGLVGENGAGKSTLVKIIGGFDDGYSGEYTLDGESVRFPNPSRAEKAGIAIAQQELSLIPAMSVAENIFLVGDSVPLFATKKALVSRAKPYLEEVGLGAVDPSIAVNRLSVGEQQLVEVASLLAHDPRVLILDEPTAALGETDSMRILEMVERLAANGKSIIYVSHRLDEIFKICHRIIVLRDGMSQEPRKASELDVHSLVESMLGRELQNMFPERAELQRNKPLLEVCGLWSDATVEPFSFKVYPGEILGLAGQLGSGSGDILSAIGGASGTREGYIKFQGKEFLPRSPKEAIEAGISYCSDDRKFDGLFLGRPIKENLSSPALGRISTFGFLKHRSEEKMALGNAKKFTIDVARMGTEAGLLSGGNQQKVALGKWLSIEPDIILVNEPTRGVDVGARAEIYGKLREFADEGKAVVFASTDIQEVTGLSDRIITFYRGMQIGEIPLKNISAATVLEQITHPFKDHQEAKKA